MRRPGRPRESGPGAGTRRAVASGHQDAPRPTLVVVMVSLEAARPRAARLTAPAGRPDRRAPQGPPWLRSCIAGATSSSEPGHAPPGAAQRDHRRRRHHHLDLRRPRRAVVARCRPVPGQPGHLPRHPRRVAAVSVLETKRHPADIQSPHREPTLTARAKRRAASRLSGFHGARPDCAVASQRRRLRLAPTRQVEQVESRAHDDGGGSQWRGAARSRASGGERPCPGPRWLYWIAIVLVICRGAGRHHSRDRRPDRDPLHAQRAEGSQGDQRRFPAGARHVAPARVRDPAIQDAPGQARAVALRPHGPGQPRLATAAPRPPECQPDAGPAEGHGGESRVRQIGRRGRIGRSRTEARGTEVEIERGGHFGHRGSRCSRCCPCASIASTSSTARSCCATTRSRRRRRSG